MDGLVKGHIAYCAAPRAGGVFAHYRTMRETLAPLGWNVRATSVGQRLEHYWQEGFADDGCVKVAAHTDEAKTVARTFCEWCVHEQVRIVFLTAPEYSLPVWNAVRHLSPDIRVISSVHGITPFSYRSVLVHPDRLSMLVAISPRQMNDVKRLRSLSAERIRLIPHAVHQTHLVAGRERTPVGSSQTLRLGYAGRLVNADKGIFLLPDIVRRLTARNVPWQLDILGAGPDEDALRRRLARLGVEKDVFFHGRQPGPSVAARMAEWDVFLMPSRHEGFGIALIEAMAAGCVPVAHRIRDVTDWIVADHQTGFVVEPGDTRTMADVISRLHENRTQLREISHAARRAAQERFAPEQMGRAYDALFTEVLHEPVNHTPRPWDAFEAVRFRRSWFNRLAHAVAPRVGERIRRVAG